MTRQLLHFGPFFGDIERNFFSACRMLHLPEVFDQCAGIDSDGADIGAGAVAGAHLDGVIFVLMLQLSQQLRPFRLPRHLTTKNDALSRGHRHVSAWAHRFAEAALYTVRSGMNVFDCWSGLEILQVNHRISAQQNIWSQDFVRIKKLFCAPHQVGEFVAPFPPNKGSHVDSCPMLRLQRAVILINYQRNQVAHETVVLLATRIFAELGNHHEMQVSVSSMPRSRRFISVFGEETEQVTSGIRKLCRRKTNVFDDEVCTLRTHFSDDAEKTITNVPGELNGFDFANE